MSSDYRDFSLVEIEQRKICPYNNAHLIPPERFAKHLIKCRKAFPDIILERCPFDSTHMFKKEDYAAHIEECPKKAVCERDIYRRNHPDYSSTADWSREPEPEPAFVYEEDDWSSDIVQQAPSYNPETVMLRTTHSRHPPQGLGKSARAKWRKIDCERIQRIKEGRPIDDLVYPEPGGGTVCIGDLLEQAQIEPSSGQYPPGHPAAASNYNQRASGSSVSTRPKNASRAPVAQSIFESAQRMGSSPRSYENSNPALDSVDESLKSLQLSSTNMKSAQYRSNAAARNILTNMNSYSK